MLHSKWPMGRSANASFAPGLRGCCLSTVDVVNAASRIPSPTDVASSRGPVIASRRTTLSNPNPSSASSWPLILRVLPGPPFPDRKEGLISLSDATGGGMAAHFTSMPTRYPKSISMVPPLGRHSVCPSVSCFASQTSHSRSDNPSRWGSEATRPATISISPGHPFASGGAFTSKRNQPAGQGIPSLCINSAPAQLVSSFRTASGSRFSDGDCGATVLSSSPTAAASSAAPAGNHQRVPGPLTGSRRASSSSAASSGGSRPGPEVRRRRAHRAACTRLRPRRPTRGRP